MTTMLALVSPPLVTRPLHRPAAFLVRPQLLIHL